MWDFSSFNSSAVLAARQTQRVFGSTEGSMWEMAGLPVKIYVPSLPWGRGVRVEALGLCDRYRQR